MSHVVVTLLFVSATQLISVLAPITAPATAPAGGAGAQTPSGQGTNSELHGLFQAVASRDRSVWFPAATELGRRAAFNARLRDDIWRSSRINTLGMKFVRIEAGEFFMGPAYTHSLWPHAAHRVRLTRPFYVCATETTNDQYALLNAGHTPNARFSPEGECPVVDLGWDQIQTFCRELSRRESAVYRLPTEAEWEYVCRAGTPSPHRFCFGDDVERLAQYSWYSRSRDRAAPVAMLKANAWGLYDIHGNVLELVNDWFSNDAYKETAERTVAVDPQGPSTGLNHTLRGGDWYMKDVRGCECGFRLPWPPISVRWREGEPRLRETIGFRLVREMETLSGQ